MDKIIEISHLSKSYGDIKAVNDLSFSVYRGELFAFLGVNVPRYEQKTLPII